MEICWLVPFSVGWLVGPLVRRLASLFARSFAPSSTLCLIATPGCWFQVLVQELGVDPDSPKYDGATTMFIAAQNGNATTCKVAFELRTNSLSLLFIRTSLTRSFTQADHAITLPASQIQSSSPRKTFLSTHLRSNLPLLMTGGPRLPPNLGVFDGILRCSSC